MAAEFVALAELLRAPSLAVPLPGADAATAPPALVDSPSHPLVDPSPRPLGSAPSRSSSIANAERGGDDIGDALREARLFQARLGDALDEAASRLLREVAAEVVARELRLAPCDLHALVERVRQRAPVVRVRVAPDEVACVRGVPVLADPALAAGDAIVELAGGALDVRLGVRLAAVLEAFA